MRESSLLELIYERSAGLGLAGAELVVGPGDDAAVIRTPGGDVLLITVDQLIEGRHYEPGTGLDLVARKAIARSVSDIAAMGGVPTWSIATGILPKDFERGDELFAAMSKWAMRWNCPLIGGDIATGDGALSLTVTVCGRMDTGAPPKFRSGARDGDEIWLSGKVGGSLRSGRHLRFEPRVDVGRNAAACADVHAMIDLSDGLGRDAGRVARASGVMIEIEADQIPLHADAGEWRTAAGDGEDYELLLVGRDLGAQIKGLLGPIGRCVKSETQGVVILDGDERIDANAMGWDH